MRSEFSAVVLTVVLQATAGQAQTSSAVIQVEDLRIPWSGVAVITSLPQWEALWHRYAITAYSDSGPVRRGAPHIDFAQDGVIVVRQGAGSGCGHQESLIRSIVAYPDSVVLALGYARPRGPYLTCAAWVLPIDAARLRLAGRQAVVHAPPDWVTKERWWFTPTLAELDSMDSKDRGAYRTALLLDPATPKTLFEALLLRATSGDWSVIDVLMRRKELQNSRRFVERIATIPGLNNQTAKSLIITRYAQEIARDEQSQNAVLELVIRTLNTRDTTLRQRATDLLNNARVRNEYDLLSRYISDVRFPELKERACSIYLARWDRKMTWLDSQGRQVSRIIQC